MEHDIQKIFKDGVWEVKFTGEIDIYNSASIKTVLARLMEEQIADVHIDCDELEYIDSTGLGALVGALKNIKSHNKEMCLKNVKPNILKLFHITNLDKVFVIEEG